MERLRRSELAVRLRELRYDWSGEHGAQFFADDIGVPLRTWINYESGIVPPGDVMLRLIVNTRVNPRWLLTGQGAKVGR